MKQWGLIFGLMAGGLQYSHAQTVEVEFDSQDAAERMWATSGEERVVRSITPQFSSFMHHNFDFSDGLRLRPGITDVGPGGYWRQLLSEEHFTRAEAPMAEQPAPAARTRLAVRSVRSATTPSVAPAPSDRDYQLDLTGTYEATDVIFGGLVGFGQAAQEGLHLEVNPSARQSDIRHFQVGFGLGYKFASGSFTIVPSFELDYLNIAYREISLDTGQDSILDQGLNSFTSSLGGRISYQFDSAWGAMEPELKVRWVHEFENEQFAHTGRVLQQSAMGARSSVQLDPSVPEQDYFNLGLGVSAQFGEGSAAFLSYEKVFGKKDSESDYTVTGGVRFDF